MKRSILLAPLLAALVAGACGIWVPNPKPKPNPPTQEQDDDDDSVTPIPGEQPAVAAALPLVQPPVRAAAPAGLRGDSGLHLALDVESIKSRFFTIGPTSIYETLARIDELSTGFNNFSKSQNHACVSQAPVAYEIEPFGEALTFYAQCYDDSNDGLTQFGKKDGVTYLYSFGGAARTAAIVTPNADDPTKYSVEAWIGIGYSNTKGCGETWDDCSYGVIHISADETKQSFEMAVAGIGFGYCGAQLASDGESVFATGSLDGPECAATDTLCVGAEDLSGAGSCDELSTFALAPLGRKATSGIREWETSRYPAEPTIVLDGTDTDSLWFGPLKPVEGVGRF